VPRSRPAHRGRRRRRVSKYDVYLPNDGTIGPDGVPNVSAKDRVSPSVSAAYRKRLKRQHRLTGHYVLAGYHRFDMNRPSRKVVFDMDAVFERHGITAARIAEIVRSGEPLCLTRWGDGELLSMFGSRGRNYSQRFYPDTCGVELGRIVKEMANERQRHLYFGISPYFADIFTRKWLKKNHYDVRLKLINAFIFQNGIWDFTTLDFCKAVAEHDGPKLFLGPRHLIPAAKRFGAPQIVVPRRSAYVYVDQLERQCLNVVGNADKVLVVLACGMTANALIWRMRKVNPLCQYIDIGHVLDPVYDEKRSRRYIAHNYNGIKDVMRSVYKPWFTMTRRSKDTGEPLGDRSNERVSSD
jgi:hypothetical protein